MYIGMSSFQPFYPYTQSGLSFQTYSEYVRIQWYYYHDAESGTPYIVRTFSNIHYEKRSKPRLNNITEYMWLFSIF